MNWRQAICWAMLSSVLPISAAIAAESAPLAEAPADWRRKPTTVEIAAYYPWLASKAGVTGRALLSCTVTADNQIQDCGAVASPTGFGFENAALRMAPTFRLGAGMRGGSHIDGVAKIPIDFQPPPGVPSERPVVTPRALDLARRYISADGFAAANARVLAANGSNILKLKADPSSPAVRKAVGEALKNQADETGALAESEMAYAVAGLFSEAELSDLDRWGQTRAGRFILEASEEGKQARAFPGAAATYRLMPTARAIYCASRPCETTETAGLAADLLSSPAKVDVSGVDWMERPQDYAILGVAPRLAQALGIAVTVRLTCKMTVIRAVEDCVVAREEPAGFGAGAGALQLAGLFKARSDPAQGDLAGKRVPVIVVFPSKLRAAPPTFPGGGPSAEHALARHVAEGLAEGAVEAPDDVWEWFAGGVASPTAETLRAGIAAMKAAKKDLAESYLESLAGMVQVTLPEADLAEAAALVDTPTWRAFKAKKYELADAYAAAQQRVTTQSTRRLNAAVCRVVSCDVLSWDDLAQRLKARP